MNTIIITPSSTPSGLQNLKKAHRPGLETGSTFDLDYDTRLATSEFSSLGEKRCGTGGPRVKDPILVAIDKKSSPPQKSHKRSSRISRVAGDMSITRSAIPASECVCVTATRHACKLAADRRCVSPSMPSSTLSTGCSMCKSRPCARPS